MTSEPLCSRPSQPLSALGEGHATFEGAAGGEGKYPPRFVERRASGGPFLVALGVAAALFAATNASAQGILPPWTDLDDVPLPTWASSVLPKRGDMIIFDAPNRFGARRGLSTPGSRLPLYGAKRGAGCSGRWLLVGAMAWVCSDSAELSGEEPGAAPFAAGENGLPFQYFFTGREGAVAYATLEGAGDAAPERELESGWAVAILEQRSAHGQRWGRTTHGQWIAMRELYPANPSLFHGERAAAGVLDFAWVKSERATVFAAPALGRASGSRLRFQKVGWYEEKGGGGGAMVRISPDAEPAEWMLARDLTHPTFALPPEEAGGAKSTDRWIDVHLGSQTLVAYEGIRPVFATLVSTGRGPQGSDHATPLGVNRIWVKITASTMDNIEREDVGKHYSMEDVPFTQFFNKAVALHGAFWHRDFGRVKSHGCVNLAPIDSKWLFGWTGPHVPSGWHAAYPTPVEKGTVVRIR